MFKLSLRLLSTSSNLLKGYSTVEPVHHLVKVKKLTLGKRFDDLKLSKDDVRRPSFKPKDIYQDRVAEHYHNTLASDLMLNLYQHDVETVVGSKKRKWDPSSPYSALRQLRKPKGHTRAQKDVHPMAPKRIPQLTGISLNLYNKDALEYPWANVSSRVLLAQLTNVKPKVLRNKSNVLQWKVRAGKVCGCKVELQGREMHRFLTTLTELVLPRLRSFQGIKESSGDHNGNITFGLQPDDVKYFPEVENFAELFPNLWGFHITLKTSAETDSQAQTLLSSLGFPFYKESKHK